MTCEHTQTCVIWYQQKLYHVARERERKRVVVDRYIYIGRRHHNTDAVIKFYVEFYTWWDNKSENKLHVCVFISQLQTVTLALNLFFYFFFLPIIIVPHMPQSVYKCGRFPTAENCYKMILKPAIIVGKKGLFVDDCRIFKCAKTICLPN